MDLSPPILKREIVCGRSLFLDYDSTNLKIVICVLFGASVPVVLRADFVGDNSDFRLIGECYVDGIMEGEAMNSPTLSIETKYFNITAQTAYHHLYPFTLLCTVIQMNPLVWSSTNPPCTRLVLCCSSATRN